nr:myb-like protein P [Tanacetum cinerariifolium]
MVVNDNRPPPPVNMEKSFGVTNIKSHVQLMLDLDQLNYYAWCELFTSHCHSFDVHGLLDGTFVCTSDNATKWKKLDSFVKGWIYGTISTSLLQTILKKNVTAPNVRKSHEDLFHDNKEAHAMELHEELRSLELGTISIVEYFKWIKTAQNHPPMQQVFRGLHVPLRATGPRPQWVGNYTYTPGDQPTVIPHAFNATTLRYADNNKDLGWFIDTGATSHLSSDAAPEISIHFTHPPAPARQLSFHPTSLRGIKDSDIPAMMFYVF